MEYFLVIPDGITMSKTKPQMGSSPLLKMVMGSATLIKMVSKNEAKYGIINSDQRDYVPRSMKW
jgi:hypothetical protein